MSRPSPLGLALAALIALPALPIVASPASPDSAQLLARGGGGGGRGGGGVRSGGGGNRGGGGGGRAHSGFQGSGSSFSRGDRRPQGGFSSGDRSSRIGSPSLDRRPSRPSGGDRFSGDRTGNLGNRTGNLGDRTGNRTGNLGDRTGNRTGTLGDRNLGERTGTLGDRNLGDRNLGDRNLGDRNLDWSNRTINRGDRSLSIDRDWNRNFNIGDVNLNPGWARPGWGVARPWNWGWYGGWSNPPWGWWGARAATWGIGTLATAAIINDAVNDAVNASQTYIVVPNTGYQLLYGTVQPSGNDAVTFVVSADGNNYQLSADCQRGLINGRDPSSAAEAELLNAACQVAFGTAS
ncbi:MAG: hypothetical protein ACKO25_08520 [Cyanobium sp.]